MERKNSLMNTVFIMNSMAIRSHQEIFRLIESTCNFSKQHIHDLYFSSKNEALYKAYNETLLEIACLDLNIMSDAEYESCQGSLKPEDKEFTIQNTLVKLYSRVYR